MTPGEAHLDEAALYAAFDKPPGRVFEFVAWVGRAHGLSRGSAVLDMGCGPGRMLLPMADLGWLVTGREPHAEYAEAARRLVEGRRDVHVVRGGWNDLAERALYDAVLAVNGPFAYLLDTASREDALARARRALRPGGLLLLDVPNFPWILRHYAPSADLLATLPDGRVARRRAHHEIDWHDAVFEHRDDFEVDGRTVATTIHRFGILPARALFDLVDRAGFGDLTTYASYESREAGRVDGARILLTACAARPM